MANYISSNTGTAIDTAVDAVEAVSGDLVGTTDTQTLTNKTLTSPTINVGSDTEGDIYYRDSSGDFVRLAPGTSGQYLQTNGAASSPSWETVVSGGDVTGAATSTDTAIAIWTGTGGDTLKNTNVTIDTTDDVYTPGDLTADGDCQFGDQGAVYTVSINSGSGYVGINTVPSEALEVNGNITSNGTITSSIVVTTGSAQVGDTLTVDTINEKTTGSGVQIESITLKDQELYNFKANINAQTGSTYTIADTDFGKILTFTSTVTVTIPNDTATGFTCTLVQIGAGPVTVTGEAGSLFYNRQNHYELAGQQAAASVIVYANPDDSTATINFTGDTA